MTLQLQVISVYLPGSNETQITQTMQKKVFEKNDTNVSKKQCIAMYQQTCVKNASNQREGKDNVKKHEALRCINNILKV